MTTELATIPVRDLEVMASRVAKSRLFSMDESQAFTLMLLCQSRGIHPIEAVMRYDIVQGRPAMKAEAMLAEFQRIGGSVEWLTDNDNAEVQEASFSHPTLCPKPKRVKFSMKDAARAGLAAKETWKRHPSNLMRARVVSTALRMLAPGIVTGIYTPEEVRDFEPPKPGETPPPMNADVLQESPLPGLELPPVNPAAEPIADGEEPYQAYLFALVQNANEYWRSVNLSSGKPEPQNVVNLFQVENHLGSWAEEVGRIAPDYLAGPNGTRSRSKLRKFLSKWHGKYREEFEGLAESHLAEKLEKAIAEAGLNQSDDADVEISPELAATVDGAA